jgi:hypothetical protein
VATYRRSRWLTREETTRRCLSHIQNAPDGESDDDYNTFQGTKQIISANRSPLRKSKKKEKKYNGRIHNNLELCLFYTYLFLLWTRREPTFQSQTEQPLRGNSVQQ